MTEYKVNEDFKIINGSNLDVLDTMPDNSVDAIITDPPYELGFMGKKWDSTGIAYNVELWKKALKVLKPGGYLLAFGGTRTYHRIACAIEDAGFEIRDCIMWLYGSGFPKSMNIGLAIDKKEGLQGQRGIGGFNVGGIQEQNNRNAKLYIGSTTDGSKKEAYTDYKSDLAKQWAGWGTQLKPAYEPIIMARKPIEETIAQNCLKWGVGGINIDECRIEFEKTQNPATNPLYRQQNSDRYKQIEKGQESKGAVSFTSSKNDISSLGRFPANVIHDGSEKVCENMPDSNNAGGSDSVSRYFYCAKANKKDRDEGLSGFKEQKCSVMSSNDNVDSEGNYTGMLQGRETAYKNIHPTVKPTTLMQYLVRLVAPKGALIVDIFNGSGSTGKAVAFENRERDANYKYIGIELEEEYCKISQARIDYALNKYEYELEKEIEKQHKENQTSLFDFI